eukprot:COSAG05_NODE_1322_length_5190_cov_6.444507_4_plen_101_part_00
MRQLSDHVDHSAKVQFEYETWHFLETRTLNVRHRVTRAHAGVLPPANHPLSPGPLVFHIEVCEKPRRISKVLFTTIMNTTTRHAVAAAATADAADSTINH